MTIYSKSTGAIRPDSVPSTSPVERTDRSPAPAAAPVPAPAARGDRVQISDAGRALAQGTGGGAALSTDRAAQIRQRVLDGAYNSLAVVDEVARRILASGDL